jgi:hypothetical protein
MGLGQADIHARKAQLPALVPIWVLGQAPDRVEGGLDQDLDVDSGSFLHATSFVEGKQKHRLESTGLDALRKEDNGGRSRERPSRKERWHFISVPDRKRLI